MSDEEKKSPPSKKELTEEEELKKIEEELEEKVLASLNKLSVEGESKILTEATIEAIADYIKTNKCSKIIVATGAGISTSAGIPDFRTPGSGLYSNLQKFNLGRPEEVFDISYFKQNPEPFTILAKEIFPSGKHKPTICHYFIRLLAEKGLLLRNYTQNVDTLERLAGISEDFLVEAHGSFATSKCIDCKKEHDNDFVKSELFESRVVRCKSCQGLVKPDVVFFGEGLPERFFKLIHKERDLQKCDLFIVIGTSLKVQPFASLINHVPQTVPRLLINLEKVGEPDPLARMLGYGAGFDFSNKSSRDVFYKATCDDGCKKLAELMGWDKELAELKETQDQKLEEQWQKEKEKHSLAE